MLPSPLCPLLPLGAPTAVTIAGLKARVLLLMSQLIRARIQIKAFPALGIVLLMLQILVFLSAAGALLFAVSQRQGARARA